MMASRSLWFDVEDLFAYTARRPTGIQRLAFEVYREVWSQHGGSGRVGFVRHHPAGHGFVAIDWPTLQARFDELTADPPENAAPAPQPPPPGGHTGLVTAAIRWLPERARKAALDMVIAQIAALRGLSDIVRALIHKPKAANEPAPAAWTTSSPEMHFASNDVLLCLGSPWIWPHYGELIMRQQARYGVEFALLVYDIIPLRRPEWFDGGLNDRFRACMDRLLPLADKVFAISRATADDVYAYAWEHELHLAEPVRVLPIGAGFGQTSPVSLSSARPADLPLPGRYALIVSTIEARKNHALLFRVWRRLLEETPRTAVPTLVFAGRVGWLVDDFMRQLENSGWLGGKIVFIEDPSDETLAHLYKGCLFTLFPSHYEGWGLPVSESLAFGKPPVISDKTSLPEAGGDLARYFDPDNLHDAYRVIRGVIEDPVGLRDWQARVVRDYQAPTWAATADALLRGLRFAPSPVRVEARPRVSAC